MSAEMMQHDEGEWFQPEDEDPMMWVDKPSGSRPGLRVVDHEGTAFIETVDSDGGEKQYLMLDGDELETIVDGLSEVLNRDDD